jgi:hypothetical protein
MEKEYEEVALLVAQAGPLNGQRWALRRSTTMGRESTCDIVIPDRQVSRQHARFTLTSEGIILEDLNSKNGTHHNGKMVLNAILLQDGDVIQIALAQKFIFLSSDSTVPLDKERFDLLDLPIPENQFRSREMSGRLKLDKRSRRVWISLSKKDGILQDNEILPPLSVSQFRLLEILYENQGQVISRQEIGNAVWGENQAFEVSEQALDALVRRLRDRIANADPSYDYIVTVRGHGLRLENPPH